MAEIRGNQIVYLKTLENQERVYFPIEGFGADSKDYDIRIENRKLGITANVILPGTIDTPANRRSDPGADRSQWVSPQKLAALALYLASDDAADITGAAIPVYGAGL